MNKLSLVVLAAGMGSRYGSLKQLDSIGPSGETISDYNLYDALEAGFNKIVFIIRDSFKEEFEKVFGPRLEGKAEVHYVNQDLYDLPGDYTVPAEREKPWGTAHAVWVARHVVKEPFAVINADDFYGKEAYIAMANFLKDLEPTDLYSCMGYKLHNTLSEHGTVNRGVCYTDLEGYLTKVVETHKISKDSSGNIVFPGFNGEDEILSENTNVSMNFWGFSPSYFDFCTEEFKIFLDNYMDVPTSEFYIPSLLQGLMDNDEIDIVLLESDATWFGMTYKEDKPASEEKVKALVADGKYPENLWSS